MKNKFLILLLVSCVLNAGVIFESVPGSIDSSKQYVIYLHGAIIERGDKKPIHPRFGLYDFPAIQQAFADKDLVLISEQRKPRTVPKVYVEKIKNQVDLLIKKGVPAKNITIVGFSKGAGITIIASDRIKNTELNYVIMANCGDWYEQSEILMKLQLTGHVLSIFEESDAPGTCRKIVGRSKNIQSFKEIKTQTGKAHGTFFLPRDVWMQPVFDWIFRKK